MSSRRARRAVGLLLGLVAGTALVLAASGAARAEAAASFRVTHKVERRTATHVELSGLVHNEAAADVIDVYVEVRALDAAGQVLARGITYVAGLIPSGQAAAFRAKVPAVKGIARFEAQVSSYRFGLGRAPEAA